MSESTNGTRSTGKPRNGKPSGVAGNIFEVDFSEMEKRVLAHYIRPRGKSVVEDDKACFGVALSPDIWKIFAADLFGVKPDQVTDNMRNAAKGIGWMRFYGAGEKRQFDQIINKYGPALGLKNRLRYRRTIALRRLKKFLSRLAAAAWRK